MTFPIHTIESAPAGSRPILEAAQKGLGFIPNLFGVMASSPAVLEAYTSLSALQDSKNSFSETERQVLFLSISNQNGCSYCVAAHSTISGMKNVPSDVVNALRDGTELPDAKLEALRTFALAVNEQRGWVDENALAAFRSAGYDNAQVLEVVLAVAFKTISNYTNHITGIEVDEAFQPQAWSAPAAV